ncbi:MAG: hypothetical protein LBL25_01880, partial [Oscillospiraceae bacterium]|nr:hypothetical protein [Oscillospiraceae bacterium]
MPYTEKITVVFTTGGDGQTHHVVDTETIDISAYMINDPARDQRRAALSGLESYYKTTFGDNPLGAENLPDALYDSFASVRYLLREAYEHGVWAIRNADTAIDTNAITTAYTGAVSALDNYATLNTAIKGGDGEAYKSYPGVLKVAVSGAKPAFAYILELGSSADADVPAFRNIPANKGRALKALEASLEVNSPGRWGIGYAPGNDDPSIYITNIGIGDGARYEGSKNGGLVFKYNDVWAPLGFSQMPVEDRGVLHLGSAANSGFLEGIPSPRQASLVWALAALREKYDDATLNANPAYVAALTRSRNWFPPGDSIPATEYQKQINDLLSALTEAFKDAGTGQYDLPEDVIAVLDLIDAIGGVTPQKGGAITAARAAYDALTSENQALVPNYDTLTDAEAAYAALLNVSGNVSEALTATLDKLKTTAANPIVATQGGEWAVIALARAGEIDKDSQIAKNYLKSLDDEIKDGGFVALGAPEGDTYKNTEYERITLALSSLGIDASNYSANGTTYNFITPYLDYTNTVTQGANAAIYALLALDSKPYLTDNTAIRQQYIEHLLTEQLDSGSWSLSETDDPDMTAMAIQALAPYRGDEAVNSAVERGKNALLAMQDQTAGGFYSGVGLTPLYNSESAAQVVVALTALNESPAGTQWTAMGGGDPLTALLSFYDDNGGFKHELGSSGLTTAISTEQAAYALAAYDRFAKGQSPLYVMADAFAQYTDVSLKSVRVGYGVGQYADATKTDGTTYAAELPYLIDLPTEAGTIEVITAASGAAVGVKTPSNNGATWTFTVTAKDGVTQQTYTLNVAKALSPNTENAAAVDAAKNAIAEITWDIPMVEANNVAEVQTWLETELASTDLGGVSARVTIVNEVNAATEGSAQNKAGIPGSFAATLTLSKGEAETVYYAFATVGISGKVTATRYKSDNTVKSVKVNDTLGIPTDTAFAVKLPFGTTGLPTAEAITIELNDTYAGVSGLTTNDGAEWTFTVTAEDGTPEYYTINVTIALDTREGNESDVAAAKDKISKHDLAIPVKSRESVQAWIEAQLDALAQNNGLNGVTATAGTAVVTDEVSDGTVAAPTGADGHFTVEIALEKGTDAETTVSDTLTVNGVIPAVAYVFSTDTSLASVTVQDIEAELTAYALSVTLPHTAQPVEKS